MITRLDIALDIKGFLKGFAPMDLAMDKPWGRKRTFVVDRGVTETIYLGRAPGNQLAVYNRSKKAELSGPVNITRMEFRSRRRMSFAKLGAMPNPFADFDVYDFSSAASPLGEPTAAHFFDSCRLRGVPGALKQVPKDLQKPYCAVAAAAIAKWWWNPKDLWTLWPLIISDLYLPKGHSLA